MIGVEELRLREAGMGDADRVLAWRNRPEIIALGSERRPVEASRHARWFAATVGSENRLLLIVELDGEPIGTVRFDRLSEGEWAVSVYLLEVYTGRGLGPVALEKGWEILRRRGATAVWAFVREDNPRSVAAFRKAGYEEVAELDVEVPPAHRALRLTAHA